MYVVTFYSFKGGVGRTHAAANVAACMATRGLRVLLVDFDIEAPGLTHMPGLNARSDQRRGGVVEFIADSWIARQTQDAARYITEIPGFDGRLALMAGGAFNASEFPRAYARTREFFAVAFDRNRGAPGLALFNDLRSAWAALEYEYVVLDSRTGLTDIGGVCTRLLPDMLVLVFTLGAQGLPGIRQVLDQVGHETLYGGRVEVKLVGSMVPLGNEELREARLAEVRATLGRRPELLFPIVDRLFLKEDLRHFADDLSPLALSYRSLVDSIRAANRWDVVFRLAAARRRAKEMVSEPLESLLADLMSDAAAGLPEGRRWEALGDASIALVECPCRRSPKGPRPLRKRHRRCASSSPGSTAIGIEPCTPER